MLERVVGKDPLLTASGQARGYIQPHGLEELWFHTGTACNLACPFCLEGSRPGDNRLERITLDHGGRIYLAKDGAMKAGSFAQMYPKLDEFRAVLDRIDPNRVMDSDMSRRLKIRR